MLTMIVKVVIGMIHRRLRRSWVMMLVALAEELEAVVVVVVVVIMGMTSKHTHWRQAIVPQAVTPISGQKTVTKKKRMKDTF